MQAIGHPILGDRLYAENEALTVSNRLLLHAQSIAFTHPKSEQRMCFSLPHEFDLEPISGQHFEHQAFIRVDD
jgi:tRNA pseudouridine32 synthase/23S rRNA pseudouridine746 synthase